MGGDTESNGEGLTILGLCDRLQELLMNNDMTDLPVYIEGTPVYDAYMYGGKAYLS